MSTTGMRWGDSDSSDEEEIRVSSLPLPGARRDNLDSPPHRPPPRQRSPPARSSGPPARQSGGQARSSDGRDRPNSTNDRDHRHDGGGRHRQKEQNWREMAKSSSRFAGNENAPAPPLDGSAWMAQRRKKLEEENEKERIDMEQRKREEEEQKRTRRKSQFDALKAAVKVIEATSSLQAAAAHTKPEPQQQAQPAPTRILTRPIDPKPKDPKLTRKNDDGKEHDQKPSSSSSEPKLLHDVRPASPHHVADSRSVQSSSTSGSTRRKEGRGGRGRRAGGGRGRNAERAKSASTLEGGAHHGRGGGRDARGGGGGGRGRNLDRAKSTDSTTVSSLEGSPSRDAHGRGGGRDAHGRSSGRRGGGGGRNRDHGGRRDHGGKQSGRGRGGSGPVQVGSSQVVRTASGNVECQVSLDHEEKKTKGELMPNGTVRLSRKKKGGQGKHSLLNTKLEIGKTEK